MEKKLFQEAIQNNTKGERKSGVIARGIKTPYIREGDNLVSIVAEAVISDANNNGYYLQECDIVCVTEAVVAIANKDFAYLTDIGEYIKRNFYNDSILLWNPIFSRNRFLPILNGIVMSGLDIIICMGYPSDEVGNHLISKRTLRKSGVDPYNEILERQDFYRIFDKPCHEFTGVDYLELYEDSCKGRGKVILCNNPQKVLKYCKDILICSIHDRKDMKEEFKELGANIVLDLSDIMSEKIGSSARNKEFGLYGANAMDDLRVKLFPCDAKNFVNDLQKRILSLTGKSLEVMVYGDGGFKDPQGKIWELADPVVSPAYTLGLEGTNSNQVKLKKFLSDNTNLLDEEISAKIAEIKSKYKHDSSKPNAVALGTTPRQVTDLVGSLADLITGSGDRGTPVVLVQNYFD